MADVTGVPGVPLIASTGGSKLAVSAILKQPTFVQAYLLSLADYLFVSDQLYRPVQDCPSGSVVFYMSTPVFADVASSYLEEFTEIPTGVTSLGAPATATARRRGLAVVVSYQMATRNDVNALNIQLEQVRNTLVKDYDGLFMTAMDAAVPTAASATTGAIATHVVASGALWATGTGTTDPRVSIAQAAQTVVVENRGFSPNALLIDQSTYWDLLQNQNTWQIYQGNVADLNPELTGRLPGRILGLQPYVTINGNIPSGDAYVMQTNVFGGISNERPLTATPWYQQREKEAWRSDVTRSAAAFIDQPLALAKITGVR
jgi:hypothetical protein